MKVCFILGNSFLEKKGGAEIQAFQLAKYLSNSGHDVYYIYEGKEDNNFKKYGIKWFTIKRWFPGTLKKSPIITYIKMRNILDSIEPDIIYKRSAQRHTGFLGGYCKRRKSKLVFAVSSDNQCKSFFRNDYFLFPYDFLVEKFRIYGVRNSDLIIAQHEKQKNMLKENFNLDSIVIPNSHKVPEGPFKKEKPPIISWIANIKKWKKPELFLDLAEKFEDYSAKFIMAGRPAVDDDYQQSIESKANSLSNTKYLGEISFEETNKLLSKSTIFVNTSLPREGFPNTYIQAWMRNTPVVTLNFDPDDILKEKKIGIHSNKFEKLVSDVKYLLENKDVRDEMGERAREHAVKNYDLEKIGKKYLEIFEELVEKV